jgi:hypothetical protein
MSNDEIKDPEMIAADTKGSEMKPSGTNDTKMNEHKMKKEKRRQNALERLGTNQPRCIICGETDWRCLESHHIAGRNFDEATVILCRNCHRKPSDDQKDHPKAATTPPDLFDRAGHFLLGLADFFVLLIEKCREYGHALIEYAKTLAEQTEVR